MFFSTSNHIKVALFGCCSLFVSFCNLENNFIVSSKIYLHTHSISVVEAMGSQVRLHRDVLPSTSINTVITMLFRPRPLWWSVPAGVYVTQGGMWHSHNLRLQPHTILWAVVLRGQSLSSLQACFALSGDNKEPSNLTHDWNTICANQLSVASAQICGHTYFISCHSCPKQIEYLEACS